MYKTDTMVFQDYTMKTAFYPICCLSLYCAETSDSPICAKCRNRVYLDSFNAWKKANNARAKDEIWIPTLFIAEVNNE